MLEIPPEGGAITFLLVEPTDSGEEEETKGTIGDSHTWEEVFRLLKESTTSKGLLAAAGAWADFDELEQVIEDIYRQRKQAQDRSVSLEP